jgi:hypothetical protein
MPFNQNHAMQGSTVTMEPIRGAASPGWRWGPFVFRLPFLHSRLHWPEFIQGTLVSTATGLALVPVLSGYFGLGFEEAVAAVLLYSVFLVISLYVFGEPYAPGWTTAALPLAIAYVAAGYPDPASRFQAMTALSLTYAALVFVLGISGLGRVLMRWMPDALKAGILLGAALSAFKQVFVDDAGRFLFAQPITTTLACAVCLICVFSLPLRRLIARYPALGVMAALGLLPGFIVAGVVGPLVGEVSYDVQWGWLMPPVGDAVAKMSPFSIGWPTLDMFLAGIPLVLITYIIQFGDWVTGNEVIREAQPSRPDDPIRIDPTRSHLSLALRNLGAGLIAPFFTTQGSLWTGVHVLVVNRWKQGPHAMRDLHSGLLSYYLMGLPFIYFLLPLLTALKPLLGIALSLTLMLTGFACAYVAMAIPRDNISRGAALLTGAALALFQPWIGLLVGIAACVLLVGREPASPGAPGPIAEDRA